VSQPTNTPRPVTIVGCLVQGNPNNAAGERRSETAAATANQFFVRTPAMSVPAGSSVTIGSSGTVTTAKGERGTTTAPPASTTAAVYRITGLDSQKLAPHVGHRVEFQGLLTNNTPSKSTTAATSVDAAGRATTKVETRLDVAGVLHATAVKTVNANCP
jgi:hypothetical protein